MKNTIIDVHAWEALDSRGRPTVGCRVTVEGGGSGRAIVPSGASTGGHEAREVRDHDQRHQGYGVRQAVDAVTNVIRPALLGRDATHQHDIDTLLVDLDGTSDLGRLGANAVLGASLATLLAAADQGRLPLWRALGGDERPQIPMPMVNIISGGAHAASAIDLQDILVIPVGAESFAQSMEWVSRLRVSCAQILEREGVWTALVADEGGLSGRLRSNEAAIAAVSEAIDRTGLVPMEQVGLAVDVAANQLRQPAGLALGLDGAAYDMENWVQLLAEWTAKYPILSWEDVLPEDEWEMWRRATLALEGTQLVGDDLFATSLDRLHHGVFSGVANAVLVKPNQAGTVTRAREVAEYAQAQGYPAIVSARSGDTEDWWLADLAVGWRASQIKVGSTMRSERTSKWNRLLEIESAGPSTFARYVVDRRLAVASTTNSRSPGAGSKP